MSKTSLLETCQEAIRHARTLGATAAEAYAQSAETFSSTIEKNDLQIATTHRETSFGIRAFVGSQVGFTSTNDTSKLDAACRDAVALAKSAPPDPHNVLPEPAPIDPVAGLHDPLAASFTVKQTVEHAIRMLEIAESIDRRLLLGDADFSSTISHRTLANSRGVSLAEDASLFTYFALATAKDGNRVSNFDFQFGAARSVSAIDVEPVTRRACEHALASLGAEEGVSFHGSVLLSPSAVYDIFIGLLVFHANARNVLRGLSRWKDQFDRPVASNRLTLVDDGRLPGGVATSSFDREGVPHSTCCLIQDGRLNAWLHNTYSAAAFGTSSNGHASGSARSLPAVGPTNLTIRPGDAGLQEIIADMPKGLLVTRFSGNVDPVSGDFSGVAKGARLIVNGRLDRAVRGTLIAGNAFEALRNLSAISHEAEQIYNALLPYVRLEKISVTANA